MVRNVSSKLLRSVTNKPRKAPEGIEIIGVTKLSNALADVTGWLPAKKGDPAAHQPMHFS